MPILNRLLPVPFASQSSDKTNAVALALFARCLDHGKWPDRVEFTKYLYLLDWSHYMMKGVAATDVRWKFFHYGPWSEDLIPAMDCVQEVFQLGWVDYSTEDREVPNVEVFVDKLSLTLESLINRIVSAFAKKDTSAVIDFCYRRTEPMIQAKRGEALDFSTVPVTGAAPIFVVPPKTLPMPQLTGAAERAKENLRLRAKANRAKFEHWKAAMEQPEYLEAMAKLAQERESSEESVPKEIRICLSHEAVDHLDQVRYE